ncbi:hypothetical protein FPOAC2_09910 [Fusarium poae]
MSHAESSLGASHPTSDHAKTADPVSAPSSQNDTGPLNDNEEAVEDEEAVENEDAVDNEEAVESESKIVDLAAELFDFLENNDVDTIESEDFSDKLKDLKAANADDDKFLKTLVNTTRQGSNTTLLHVAAKEGFCEIVKQLVEEGADVNAQDHEDNQPLHLACYEGHDRVVEVLLAGDVYKPQPNEDGRYPLHLVCGWFTKLQPGTVKRLYDYMPSFIDEKEGGSGWTPVNKAAYWGNEDIVGIFLDANARLDIGDFDGWTPLISAAKEGYFGVFNKIVHHLKGKMEKDDVTYVRDVVDKQDDLGLTALMFLCSRLSEEGESLSEVQTSVINLLELGPDLNLLKGTFDFLFFEGSPLIGFQLTTQALVDSCKGEKARLSDLLSWLVLEPKRHSWANLLVVKLSGESKKKSDGKLKPDDVGKWAIYNQQPGCLLNYVKAISENNSVVSRNVKGELKRWMHTLKDQQQIPKFDGKGQGPKSGKQQAGEGSGKDEKNAEERHNRQSKVNTGQKKVIKATKGDTRFEDHLNDYFQGMEDIIDLFCVGKASIRESRDILKPEAGGEIESSMKIFHAAIIQLRQENDEVGIYAKYRTVHHVIHGNESLDTVRDIMKRCTKELTPGNSSDSGSDESSEDQEQEEFTWIHLPSTNMIWMQDILKRVSTRSDYSDKKFQELASFLRTTWVQIPDKSTSSRFMRPQYVENKSESHEHNSEECKELKTNDALSKRSDCSALYA